MVKTYKERREAHKRTKLKYNSWPNSKSRKKRYQAMGAPVKDSKRVYHAKTMQTLFIQAFLQIPGVREALQQLRAKREEDERESRNMLHEALVEEAEEKMKQLWSNNKKSVNRTGIGVRATDTVNVNTNIAPYTGYLTDFNYDDAEDQNKYVIGLQSKGKGNKALFIDAEHWGTMARFGNHSCTPNTQFVRKRHNKEVHVMVQTTTEINPGEEVTVDYQVMWLTHGCRTARCRDPNNPIFREAKRSRK
ncbi:hypothetical protein PHMEG_00026634 [Phytophthora megakarya]|uniref:SET domain-containing protein n=1 Tax=Phytophthora megakarya TaxID=4795 RepID=A0A225V9A9_9STRA|nr:hypothetical protein PHMEG_00026634 [Phytophthora megakarya]